MFFCTFSWAVPSFIVGTLLLYIFGIWLKWLPAIGLKTPAHYIMPAFALSLSPMSYITRLLRANMLDVIDQDYIKTARAKGLSRNKVVLKHALRNSILPIITYLGPMTAFVVTGGVVVERIFNIPGLGKYFVETIMNRDYMMIMGTTIFLATLVITANFIVDILYRVIDPRIELQ
jgi:oligopeptide transport system permease protein